MNVVDRNQTNSAGITVDDVSIFSKGNDENNNNDNNNKLSHYLNNVNSTTCPPEDKMNNASRCNADNINGIKENLPTEKKSSVPRTKQSFKRVIVLGDSMLKSVNGWEMSRKTTNCKFSIKSFSGAKIKGMNDYIKPSLREDPNHFILYIGTNDITKASKFEELIAEEILELALKLKSETHEVSISNVIVRRGKWSAKVQKLNEHLKQPCRKYNFFLKDNCKFIKIHHLNKIGIHLNKKGGTVLGMSFVNHAEILFN